MKMNRFFALLVLLVFACGAVASGCGSSCEELDEICDKCVNVTVKQGCKTIAHGDDEDACEERLPGYRAIDCP